jgi:hypothetical protein
MPPPPRPAVKSCVELATAVDACANAAAAEENAAQQQGRAPQQRRCHVTLACGPAADYRCLDSYGAPLAMVYRGSGALIVRAAPGCRPRVYGGATERPFFSVGGGRASMTLQGLAVDGGGVRRGASASGAALISLVNTDVANCSATYAGAALLAEGTPVSISGGTFSANAVRDATGAGYGAALCILTGAAPPAATPARPSFVNIFNRAAFVSNNAPTAGALFFWKSSPDAVRVALSRASFRGNAGGECSSLAVGRSDASAAGATAGAIELSLSSVTFAGARPPGQGGAGTAFGEGLRGGSRGALFLPRRAADRAAPCPPPPRAGNTAPNKAEGLAVCGSAAKPFAPSTVTYNPTTARYLGKPSKSDDAFNDFLFSQSA